MVKFVTVNGVKTAEFDRLLDTFSMVLNPEFIPYHLSNLETWVARKLQKSCRCGRVVKVT